MFLQVASQIQKKTSTTHEPVAIRRNVGLGDDEVEIDKHLNCFQQNAMLLDPINLARKKR
jgi:hypothetical protein